MLVAQGVNTGGERRECWWLGGSTLVVGGGAGDSGDKNIGNEDSDHEG